MMENKIAKTLDDMRADRWEKAWNHLTEKRSSDDLTFKQELNSMRLMYIMMYLKHGWDDELLMEVIDNLIG